MNKYIINLPLIVLAGRKNPFRLNLNQYRNAHYHTLSDAKVDFAKLVSPLVQHLPVINKLKIEYIVYYGTKHKVDLSNICSVVDKFFCDTLTESGKIPDDNNEILAEISFKFGGVDKTNPRVEAIVYDLLSNPEEIINEGHPSPV